jgi:hypothetical protein
MQWLNRPGLPGNSLLLVHGLQEKTGIAWPWLKRLTHWKLREYRADSVRFRNIRLRQNDATLTHHDTVAVHEVWY